MTNDKSGAAFGATLYCDSVHSRDRLRCGNQVYIIHHEAIIPLLATQCERVLEGWN